MFAEITEKERGRRGKRGRASRDGDVPRSSLLNRAYGTGVDKVFFFLIDKFYLMMD